MLSLLALIISVALIIITFGIDDEDDDDISFY